MKVNNHQDIHLLVSKCEEIKPMCFSAFVYVFITGVQPVMKTRDHDLVISLFVLPDHCLSKYNPMILMEQVS